MCSRSRVPCIVCRCPITIWNVQKCCDDGAVSLIPILFHVEIANAQSLSLVSVIGLVGTIEMTGFYFPHIIAANLRHQPSFFIIIINGRVQYSHSFGEPPSANGQRSIQLILCTRFAIAAVNICCFAVVIRVRLHDNLP